MVKWKEFKKRRQQGIQCMCGFWLFNTGSIVRRSERSSCRCLCVA